MKKNLILSILVMTSLMLMVMGGVSAVIENVYTEPEYPNLDSDLVKVHATISDGDGIDYANLYYQIEGDSNIYSDTFTGPFSNGEAGIYYANPQDNVLVNYHIKVVDNLDNVEWHPNQSTWLTFTYDGSNPTVSILGYLPGLIVDKDGVTVEITCEDSISGCDEIGYDVHDSVPTHCSTNPSDYTLQDSVSITGHQWVCGYAIDNAGNEDFTGPVEFNVFDTIQGAINAANSGDIINVVSDDYDESILIDRSLTLIGVGEKPVITGASVDYIVKIDGTSNVVIDNVEVNGGGFGTDENAFNSGILVSNSNTIEIANSIVTNIWKTSSNGIDVTSSQNVVIHDNTLTHVHKRYVRYTDSNGILHTNIITGDNVDGITRVQNLVNLWGGSNVEIYGNTLSNALSPGETRTWDSPGIFVTSHGGNGDSYANIHDNEIYYCDSGIVIGSVYAITDGSTAVITNNNLHDLEWAIIFELEDKYDDGENTISATISGNTFADNDYDFYRMVNLGGTDNYYGGIQYAIDNADPSDTLNVYSGTYDESIVINKPLTLVANDNQVSAIINQGVKIDSDGVTLEGFYIKHSTILGELVGVYLNDHDNVNIISNEIDGQSVGSSRGIVTVTGADYNNVVIKNNVIHDLTTGIYTNPHTGVINIENNEIYNTVAGIGGLTGANVRYNIFHDNDEAVGVDNSLTNYVLEFNQFLNDDYVKNYGTVLLIAENNWWGDLDPSDQVSINVDYTPWAYAKGLYDDEAPTSTIDSPDEGSLFAFDFIVEITDSDTGGAGLNTAACEYQVTSNDIVTKFWTLRDCGDSEITITVGDTKDCHFEGEGVCKIEVKSVDNSGNDVLAERTFSIDWTNPPQILNSGPSGIIVNNWAVLFVETNKPAICKYDVAYKTNFDAMDDYMGTTDGTMNSQLITDLLDKQYAYYVLCKDNAGNEMTQTVSILFDVDTRELFTVTIPETKGDYLSEGWNQFFLPSFVLDGTGLVAPYKVGKVLTSIDEKYNIVYHFDGTGWKSYVPNREVNDLPEFPEFTEFNGGGFPYFIHMKVAGERIEIQ